MVNKNNNVKDKINSGMGQSEIPLKILWFFIDNPYEEVYLRELAKKLSLSVFAIKKYVDILVDEKLVLEYRRANLRYFKGNMNSLFFKSLKTSFNIQSIEKSGLIGFIKEEMVNVTSIVLFGSMAKGENDKDSDIDILIIGKEKNLAVSEFGKKMGREITLHVFSWSDWNKQAKENKAFYYDIITQGIPLHGELPIVSQNGNKRYK